MRWKIIGMLTFAVCKPCQASFCQFMPNSQALMTRRIYFLLSRNNCQWRFSSLRQIVWLVVMLLFVCMPVDGVLIHRAVAYTYHAISVVNWNTNIDSIVHALDLKLQARWSSVGLDPFACKGLNDK